MKTSLTTIITRAARGEVVLLTAGEGPERTGRLVVVASCARADSLALMLRHGSGIVRVPLEGAQLRRLARLVDANGADPWSAGVDFKPASKSGADAAARAATIRALADPAARPSQFISPGHVFPTSSAHAGDDWAGCASSLARAAGAPPTAALCEPMTSDGREAAGDDLLALARSRELAVLPVADLQSILSRAPVLREVAEAELPTAAGAFRVTAFGGDDERVHVALTRGDPGGAAEVLVRIQQECVVGDLLRAVTCDCGRRLQAALSVLAAEPNSVLVYVREARPDSWPTIGLRCGALSGLEDRFAVAASILGALGVRRLRLLSDGPGAPNDAALDEIEVLGRVTLAITRDQPQRRRVSEQCCC